MDYIGIALEGLELIILGVLGIITGASVFLGATIFLRRFSNASNQSIFKYSVALTIILTPLVLTGIMTGILWMIYR
jgi:hypothetical protein